MRVTLRDGSQTRSFQFVEPSRDKWNKQNCEFLRGVKTGLPAPFDRVFVKRVSGEPVTGHKLLIKLIGKTLPASPRVYGVYQNGERYLYFFQDLPASFKTLDEELETVTIIAPELVRRVVSKASAIFKVIRSCGFVYIDFCTKNIMRDRKSGSIAIIDIDSTWPVTRLRTEKPNSERGQIEFWGLWNETLSKCVPLGLENAQKSVLLSYAAVWSRALVLKVRGTGRDVLSALTLVHNPSIDRQRPLWDALACHSKNGFMEYFELSTKASPVYIQWESVFNYFLRGRDVAWYEITKAADNLLKTIEENKRQQGMPKVKRVYALASRTSKKATMPKWSVIAQAEAEDIKALIGDRK